MGIANTFGVIAVILMSMAVILFAIGLVSGYLTRKLGVSLTTNAVTEDIKDQGAYLKQLSFYLNYSSVIGPGVCCILGIIAAVVYFAKSD